MQLLPRLRLLHPPPPRRLLQGLRQPPSGRPPLLSTRRAPRPRPRPAAAVAPAAVLRRLLLAVQPLAPPRSRTRPAGGPGAGSSRSCWPTAAPGTRGTSGEEDCTRASASQLAARCLSGVRKGLSCSAACSWRAASRVCCPNVRRQRSQATLPQEQVRAHDRGRGHQGLHSRWAHQRVRRGGWPEPAGVGECGWFCPLPRTCARAPPPHTPGPLCSLPLFAWRLDACVCARG